MKIEKNTLKIFLTSGITVTVGDDEHILVDDATLGLVSLGAEIENCIKTKSDLVFDAVIKHKYKDEKGKEKEQEIKHHYCIPSERISWYMIEEV